MGGGGSIQTHTLTITTTGGGGAATGSAVTSHIEGYVLDVYANYHASAPGTTDLTVKQTGRTDNILVVSNSATDALYAPRQACCDSSAAALVPAAHDYYPVNGTITASLAQCDALTGACVVTVRVLRI